MHATATNRPSKEVAICTTAAVAMVVLADIVTFLSVMDRHSSVVPPVTRYAKPARDDGAANHCNPDAVGLIGEFNGVSPAKGLVWDWKRSKLL
jgi:hypothetical protein